MKKTLLEVVKSVLNAMESDPVNSISDTEESLEVVVHAQEAFESLLTDRDWPFLRTKYQLVSLADTSQPTTMGIPEGAGKVFWLKYNGKDVAWMDPKPFQDMLDQRKAADADNIDENGFGTDKDPMYFTSFNDNELVFDSRNQADDAVLQASKSVAYGTLYPQWESEDDFVIPLPGKMMPMYMAEVKSVCFLNIKQQANPKEERKSQRGRNIMQNEAWRNNAAEIKNNSLVDYGRKR